MAKGQSLYDWCLENGEYGQQLINEWTGRDKDYNNISIDEITYGSHVKMIWKCCKWHTYKASIHDRTGHFLKGQKTGCPYCSGRRPSEENNLLTWCKSNGDFGQQLIQEWTGICDDGNTYKITDITKGARKKMLWKCKNGHEWHARINTRTVYFENCPYCTKNSTSYPEQFIYCGLKQIFPQAVNRYKALKKVNGRGIEFDIAIPIKTDTYNALCIEYSPTRWHKGKEEIDNEKINICKKYNVRLIQIIEDTYNEYEEKWDRDIICFHMEEKTKDKLCIKVLESILNSIGHSISEIDIDKVISNARKASLGEIDIEKSIGYLYPELVKEWHPTLNKIVPDNLTSGSHYDAYWICNKCGYGKNGEFKSMVHTRASMKHGCPSCGYNWYTKEYAKSITTTLAIKGKNDLITTHPELAKEYNTTLNDRDITAIKYGHHKKVFWTCINCGYGENGEWKAPPSRRTAKGYETGCPQCGYHWYKAEIGQPQKLKYGYKLNI